MKPLLVVLVVALGVGVWVLREQTMTVHQPVDPDSSLEVVIVADTRTTGDPIRDLTHAHLEVCVAESVPGTRVVRFERTPDVEEAPAGGETQTYTARLQPGADAPDRDQLHGCLEDVRVRHLRLEVERMTMWLDGEVVQRRAT